MLIYFAQQLKISKSKEYHSYHYKLYMRLGAKATEQKEKFF